MDKEENLGEPDDLVMGQQEIVGEETVGLQRGRGKSRRSQP